MAEDKALPAALNTRVDVSPGLPVAPEPVWGELAQKNAEVLRQLLAVAQEQLVLSRQLLQLAQQPHRQRHAALQRWQKDNPELVRRSRYALGIFEKVQKSFLDEMTNFIVENEDGLVDAEFILTDFTDRFGPRLLHLTSVMTVLQQLSAAAAEPAAESS